MTIVAAFTSIQVDDNLYIDWDGMICAACHQMGDSMAYEEFVKRFNFDPATGTYWWAKDYLNSWNLAYHPLAFSDHLSNSIFGTLIPNKLIDYHCDQNGAVLSLTDAGKARVVADKMTQETLVK